MEKIDMDCKRLQDAQTMTKFCLSISVFILRFDAVICILS